MSQAGPFDPQVGDEIIIGGQIYVFRPNPVIKGIAYALEGGRGRVYKLVNKATQRTYGIKIFRKKWRTPEIAQSAVGLTQYRHLPGMEVCNRTILTPETHGQLIALNDELSYAALMPWIEGRTWFDYTFAAQGISRAESIAFAKSFCQTLFDLEEMRSAHTDIAGANIVISGAQSAAEQQSLVNLVDVEEMFGPAMPQPIELPAGQAGYQHKTASIRGNWHACGDRFGSAVILAEMLGWHDAGVRQYSSGDGSYFLAQEIQGRDDARYTRLVKALRDGYPSGVADLFEQAWASDQPEDCPSLGDWSGVLSPISSPVKRRKVGTASVREPLQVAAAPIISSPPVVPVAPPPVSYAPGGQAGPPPPPPPAPPPPLTAAPAEASHGGLRFGWLAAGVIVIVVCLGVIIAGVIGGVLSAGNIPAGQTVSPTATPQVEPTQEALEPSSTPFQSSPPTSGTSGSDSGSTSGSVDCPGALGPSFKESDHFRVPYGDGPSALFEHPNEVPKVTIMQEGSGGTVLGGPVCVKGQDGNLLAWYVQSDSGYKGWIAEGYETSKVPWMVLDP